jgi:hypothetical protein
MEQITEEMKKQDEWYAQAKQVTSETLPTFVTHLIADYGHDYGTICHAIAAAAIAAAHSVDNSPMGGITGFQASAVMWEFITHWMYEHEQDHPRRLIDFEYMLYPQYGYRFATISKETWDWLQKEALLKLNEHDTMHPDVMVHMMSIVAGTVPFGYSIE